MIDILFNYSAAESLKIAQHYGKGRYCGGCSSVILRRPDGGRPTKAEIRAARQEAEEKSRIAWENAVPLNGNPDDIFGLDLALSVGPIAGEDTDAGRRQVLEGLFSIYPEEERYPAVQETLKRTVESLTVICSRLAAGEAVRIWYSSLPDDMCGFYRFMCLLEERDADKIKVSAVRLPEWEAAGSNAMRKSGWGELLPDEWSRYLKLEKSIPPCLIREYARRWRELQKENAPLRAVLNGQLVSTPENLYDSFILREIEEEGEEFKEGKVIAKVLSKYQLGISDGWVALRIEKLVQDKRLDVINPAAKSMPGYLRLLKKNL